MFRLRRLLLPVGTIMALGLVGVTAAVVIHKEIKDGAVSTVDCPKGPLTECEPQP